MKKLNRRSLLSLAGAAAVAPMGCSLAGRNSMDSLHRETKPIRGSWFEFQHHNQPEGVYWNPQCRDFSCGQWEDKVKEISEIGMDHLVLMCTALYFKAFYETGIFPRFEIACNDPIEAILDAGDRYGVKFFMGGGFYGDWMSPEIIADPDARAKRLRAIAELAERYGDHGSFYGWYWPNEAYINKHFSDRFIGYVNECSGLARSLMPGTKTLIAPYGTRVAVPDDRFVKQLDEMDIDIIAYQDEIGVRKSTPDETPAFYEGTQERRMTERLMLRSGPTWRYSSSKARFTKAR